MGGLGIAAGAFEGDKVRAEQMLQAAQLQQQDAQARKQTELQQQRQTEQSRQFDVGVSFDAQKLAEQQRQFGISTQMQGQENQRRAQSDAFDQQQTLRQNDWAKVENDMKRKKFEAEYAEFKKIADEGNRVRQERASMLESWTGKLVRMALDGGPVAPEALDAFNKATGSTIQQAYPDGLGGVTAKRLVKDPQSGQMVLTDVNIDPDMVRGIKKSMGMEDVSDPIKNAYMSERGQALEDNNLRRMSEIDKIKFDSATRMFLEASKNYDDPGKEAAKSMMDEISMRYEQGGSRQPQPQPQKKQEAPRPSIRESMAQPNGAKVTTQGTATQPSKFIPTKEAVEIKDIILQYVPQDQQRSIVEELRKIDPLLKNPETIMMLRKRFVEPKNDRDFKGAGLGIYGRNSPRM